MDDGRAYILGCPGVRKMAASSSEAVPTYNRSRLQPPSLGRSQTCARWPLSCECSLQVARAALAGSSQRSAAGCRCAAAILSVIAASAHCRPLWLPSQISALRHAYGFPFRAVPNRRLRRSVMRPSTHCDASITTLTVQVSVTVCSAGGVSVSNTLLDNSMTTQTVRHSLAAPSLRVAPRALPRLLAELADGLSMTDD